MTDTPDEVAAQTAVTLQSKFENLRTVLNTELIERGTIIDTSILALLGRVHHFQLGSPGVAKSMIVQRLRDHIGGLSKADYFEVLMTRFSAPEEIFGPLDLVALQESKYKFMTDGYLPLAKFAFLDEIWKANASILNSLLWILNEGKFRNEGEVNDVPLWSMFCASNEMPEGEELNALYDRIHFRHIVRPIQEAGAFINMLKLAGGPTEGVILDWSEVEQARAEAAQVIIPDDVWEALNQIRMDLKADGIEPTDRRFKSTTRIIQAEAWLKGCDTADIEHMRPLAHVLWTIPEEQPKVERMLLELANPLDKQAMELRDEVDTLGANLDKVLADKAMDQTLRNKKGVELHNKVERAKEDLQKLIEQVETSGRKSAVVDDVKNRLLSVTKRLLKELFNIPVDADTKL